MQLHARDRKIFNSLHEILDKNMDNTEFSIDQLAREIGVSYSALYAKVKTLTGQTPQVFMATYRLNTAKELLETGKYTVSEVSDKVGASTPHNFSRDFKKHFGITPSSVKNC